MTNFKHLSLTCTILVLATISSTLPLGHCRDILQPNDAKLIEDTCNKTPNPNLCLQLLKSNPNSSNADVKGLALIMVDVITAKAIDALNKIHQLQGGGGGNKDALDSCSDNYKAILEGDVPQATQGLKFGNPKFAEDGASDSAVEATSCEKSFNGKSPLTNENNGMRDVADVARAIIRLLL